MPRLAAFGPSTEPKPHLRVTSTDARCDFRYDQVTGVPSRCLATRSIICAAIEATAIHRFGQAVGDPTREGHCAQLSTATVIRAVTGVVSFEFGGIPLFSPFDSLIE